MTILIGTASAQQPAAKKAPSAVPTAAPSPQGAAEQAAWVKLCETVSATATTADGKSERKDHNICLTQNERFDPNSGLPRFSAAIRQVDGSDKQHFMVTVPLGLMLPPGLRAIVYPKDLWEKRERKEKVDEGKLKPLALSYTLCHTRGCDGELEATPELLKNLKTGGGFIIFAVNTAGEPVGFPVPLEGFDQAYTGPPSDAQKYREARRALMQQIEGQQKIRATIVVPK